MLTENELKFMEFMERVVIPARNTGVSFDDIRYAAGLIGYQITGNCGTCFRNYGIDLLNLFGGMEVKYKEHKETVKDNQEWIPIHLRKKNNKKS